MTLEEQIENAKTQSHDQVLIIEHLTAELAKERELRKELVQWMTEYMSMFEPGLFPRIESLIQKSKDVEQD